MRALMTVTLLAVGSGGCVTAGRVERQSLTAGTPVMYAAPPDTVLAAARRILASRELELMVDSRPDSLTRLIVGGRPYGLFDHGEWIRFVIGAAAGDTSYVRIVWRTGNLLQWGDPDRAPSILRGLDAHLDARAVLVPGTRVRVGARGTNITGELRGWRGDSLVLGVGSAEKTTLPLGELARVSAQRGYTTHPREFGVAGGVIGLLVGLATTSKTPSDGPWDDMDRYARTMGSSAIGMLAGALLGSQIRTPVWSDVPLK